MSQIIETIERERTYLNHSSNVTDILLLPSNFDEMVLNSEKKRVRRYQNFPRDPKYLISAGRDEKIQIFNLYESKVEFTWRSEAKEEWFECLFFFRSMLFTTNYDGYLLVFRIDFNEENKIYLDLLQRYRMSKETDHYPRIYLNQYNPSELISFSMSIRSYPESRVLRIYQSLSNPVTFSISTILRAEAKERITCVCYSIRNPQYLYFGSGLYIGSDSLYRYCFKTEKIIKLFTPPSEKTSISAIHCHFNKEKREELVLVATDPRRIHIFKAENEASGTLREIEALSTPEIVGFFSYFDKRNVLFYGYKHPKYGIYLLNLKDEKFEFFTDHSNNHNGGISQVVLCNNKLYSCANDRVGTVHQWKIPNHHLIEQEEDYERMRDEDLKQRVQFVSSTMLDDQEYTEKTKILQIKMKGNPMRFYSSIFL